LLAGQERLKNRNTIKEEIGGDVLKYCREGRERQAVTLVE
jgi:hypothetical protein